MPRILIADDDPLFRESLSGNLLDSGYDIEGFPDGETVLDWFGKGNDGDLILLDWKMPKVNGIEVLRRLRERGCEVAPPVRVRPASVQQHEWWQRSIAPVKGVQSGSRIAHEEGFEPGLQGRRRLAARGIAAKSAPPEIGTEKPSPCIFRLLRPDRAL